MAPAGSSTPSGRRLIESDRIGGKTNKKQKKKAEANLTGQKHAAIVGLVSGIEINVVIGCYINAAAP